MIDMIINMNGAKAPETPSSVLQEKTVTPETLPTVIGPDEGYDGLSQVTVNPDAQLKAENIRSGKSIFGVAGAFEGSVKLMDGIPFDEVWSAVDNQNQWVLHRFTNDELIATEETAPSSSVNISYGEYGEKTPIRYYDSVTGIAKGRFSGILNESYNASWWSTKLMTPSVTIPAQTVDVNYYNLGSSTNLADGSRILVRFAIGVTSTSSDTTSYPNSNKYVANKKENLKIMDVEIDAPKYGAPTQLELPEMTIAPAHVYSNSDSYHYAVMMCVVSWRLIT